MDTQVTAKLEKLASMVLYDVPQKTIAAATGLSEGRISQIIATEEYKAIAEKIAVEQFEEQELLNQGWDGVEQKSVATILNYLNATEDQDYALKAAAIANKATRRGSYRNNAIAAQNAGVRAVINLNPTFVSRLQTDFEIGAQKIEKLTEQKKDHDFLPAGEVQTLLNIKNKNRELAHVHKTIVTNAESTETGIPELDDLDF